MKTLTMTFTIREWRWIAVALTIARKSSLMTIGLSSRKRMMEMADQIVTETGKFDKDGEPL